MMLHVSSFLPIQDDGQSLRYPSLNGGRVIAKFVAKIDYDVDSLNSLAEKAKTIQLQVQQV